MKGGPLGREVVKKRFVKSIYIGMYIKILVRYTMEEHQYTINKGSFYKVLFSTSLMFASEQGLHPLTLDMVTGAIDYMSVLSTSMNVAILRNQLKDTSIDYVTVKEYVRLIDLLIRNENSINYVKAVKIDELYLESVELVRCLLQGEARLEQLRTLQRSYQYWSMHHRMAMTHRHYLH